MSILKTSAASSVVLIVLAAIATDAFQGVSPVPGTPPTLQAIRVNPTSEDCYVGPGCLDPTFGEKGKVRPDPGGNQNPTSRVQEAKAIVVQPDGKIVVGGKSRSVDTGFFWVIARFDTNGLLDAGFGAGGFVKVDFTPTRDPESVTAIALRADGHILVTGTAGTSSDGSPQSAVIRLTSTGVLDTSFGSSGKLIVNLGGANVLGMAVQRDGRILLVADRGPSTFNSPVTRLMPDGGPDTTFGSQGVRFISSGSAGQVFGARAIALQSDGGILVGGAAYPPESGSGSSFVMCRLTPAGSLDASFGSSGRAIVDFPGLSAEPLSIGIAADDSIVAAGVAGHYAAQDMVIVRLTSSGAPNGSFGDAGRVILDIHGSADQAVAVLVDTQGKIVFGGHASLKETLAPKVFILGRLTTHGGLDPTFGTGGVSQTAFTTYFDQAFALVADRSGRLILAGSANGTGPGSLATWAIARYLR